MTEDMIVFTRCLDLLAWLVPKAERFPRTFRLTVTQRLIDAALDLQEALFEAQSQRADARITALRSADAALGRLRLYLRLAHRWQWLSTGQFEHVSVLVDGTRPSHQRCLRLGPETVVAGHFRQSA